MAFGLVVRFTTRDEEAARAFDALAASTLEEIRAKEPETLIYANHAVEGEPAVRVFYELYADRAAFDRHEEQPHVRHFLAEREQYLTGVDVTFLTEIDGKGTAGEGSTDGR